MPKWGSTTFLIKLKNTYKVGKRGKKIILTKNFKEKAK